MVELRCIFSAKGVALKIEFLDSDFLRNKGFSISSNPSSSWLFMSKSGRSRPWLQGPNGTIPIIRVEWHSEHPCCFNLCKLSRCLYPIVILDCYTKYVNTRYVYNRTRLLISNILCNLMYLLLILVTFETMESWDWRRTVIFIVVQTVE